MSQQGGDDELIHLVSDFFNCISSLRRESDLHFDSSHSFEENFDEPLSSDDSSLKRASLRPTRTSLSDGVNFVKRTVATANRISLPFAADGNSARSLMSTESSLSSSSKGSENAESLLPITDIQLLFKGQRCPPGYEKVISLSKTSKPVSADLNKGFAGKSVQLCIKRGGSESKPITGIVVFHEAKEEFVPPGYDIVGCTMSGVFLADLSFGMNNNGRTFLCVCRGEGPPLVDLCVLPACSPELLPEEFGILERTPLGYSALLNSKSKSHACFLCTKRLRPSLELFAQPVLENVELFNFPKWLVASASHDSMPIVINRDTSQEEASPSYSLFPVTFGHASKSSSFRTVLQLEDVKSYSKVLACIYPMLLACYSSDVPSIIFALQSLEKLVRTLPILDGSPISLADVIIKAASDSTELGLDILFTPAMHLVRRVTELSLQGLNPPAVHALMRTISRTSCFFRMLPIKLYTSNSHHRTSDSHRFTVLPESAGSENEDSGSGFSLFSARSGNVPSMRSPASPLNSTGSLESFRDKESLNDLLAKISHVTLEDLNFLLRCSAQVFDQLSSRAGKQVIFAKTSINGECGKSDSAARIVQLLVEETLESAQELHEKMNVTDEALKRLSKHASESLFFTKDLYKLLCRKLALPRSQENLVMVLVWLSLSTSMRLNAPLRKGRLFNAELNQRNTMLHLLKEVIACSGSIGGDFLSGPVFGYQLRRFTFPTVLVHLGDLKRLDLIFPVLSELWKSARRQLKVEFAVVLEKVLLGILNDRYCSPSTRRDLLENLVSWFGMHPGDLVELFLNFESDPLVPTWKSFERLMSTLTFLADPSSFPLEGDGELNMINKEVQYDSLASIVTLLRSLTDMSGTLRLMASDERLRERSTASSESGLGWDLTTSLHPTETSKAKKCSENSTDEKTSSVKLRFDRRTNVDRLLEQAIKVAHEKGVGKCISLLVDNEMLDLRPSTVASFLHVFYRELGETNIGEYLGRHPTNNPFMNQVRLDFTRALSFGGKSFEQCLRIFLEQGHFFLPGESQQVEALLEAFATCFVEANPDEFGPSDSDMIMVLAYSTVMLNTDLHNPAVNKKKKMTEEQFLRQISFIENGSRISNEFGTRLYRSIAGREIKMAACNGTVSCGEPLGHRLVARNPLLLSPSTSSEESFKGFIQADDRAHSLTLDIQSEVGASRVVSSFKGNDGTMTRERANALFQAKLTDAVSFSRIAIEAHSRSWKHYHTKVTSEAVKVMFESSWSHFYSLVTKILESPRSFHLDCVSLALDILSHSISISLFLGMDTERKAFAMLLAKFHYLYTKSDSHHVSTSVQLVKGDHLKEKWYADLISASHDSENVIEVISEVHHLTTSMKEKISNRQNQEKLLAVQKRFDGAVNILENEREFVREGPLLKRCRNNKYRKYHFFLFSDLLIYASQRTLGGNKFHAHQMLPLHTMQVRDTEGIKSFEVRHPRKSFVVQATSEQEKHEWMRDIRREVDTLYQKQFSSAPTSPSAIYRGDRKSMQELSNSNPSATRNSMGSSSLSTASELSARVDNRGESPKTPVKPRSCSTNADNRSTRHIVQHGVYSDTEGDDDDGDAIQDPKSFDCDIYDDEEEEDPVHLAQNQMYRNSANMSDTSPISGVDGGELEPQNMIANGRNDALEEEENDDLLEKNTARLFVETCAHVPILESPSTSRGLNPDGIGIGVKHRERNRFTTLKVISSNSRMQKQEELSCGVMSPDSVCDPASAIEKDGLNNYEEVEEKVMCGGRSIPPQEQEHEEKLEWLKSIESKVGKVEQHLLEMDLAELHKSFVVGLRFAKPILMSSHGKYQATDEQKLLIYGFFKQSTQGDCDTERRPPTSDWVQYSKFKVWESLQGTSKTAAKRKFLAVLSHVAPGWSERTTVTA